LNEGIRAEEDASKSRKAWRRLITGLAIYSLCALTVVGTIALLFMKQPSQRAVIGMGITLNVVWCVIGGLLMLRFRDRVRDFARSLPFPWAAKFIVFCTLLALTEEAVTVSITNLAPLYGVKVGQAYITASANYLDVVCCHSVVVFVPMFCFWAWMLSRYDFSPPGVFLLYGITGNLAEISFGGAGAVLAGFWIFVYGLMIYLPAYSLPTDRNVRPPRWYHGVMAVFLPFLCAAPVVGVVHWLAPHRPIHFPPVQ
jgi:hypothetical protein